MKKKDISEHYKKIGIMPEMSMLAFQAESVALWVTSMLNLDCSDYSLGYIAGWSSDKEVPELKDNLELIKKTADQISSSIEEELAKRIKQKAELEQKPDNEGVEEQEREQRKKVR